MDLTALLRFIPLIIGAFLAYHLIFRQKLPSEGLGSIITYFLGIIIVFVAVGWLISLFLPRFATDLLDVGRNSAEWQEFITNSENIVNEAFNEPGGLAQPTTAPTTVQIVVTATPSSGGGSVADPRPDVYTVVTGDTLFDIAQRFNTTVNDIMVLNGLNSVIIHPGDQLRIPQN